MPTTIETPSNADAKVRFREPYVSEGLNKKFNGVVPAGVVRGGRLVTSGGGLVVNLEPDPEYGDSVYSHIDAGGNQITFRQDGLVGLNLSPVASSTVYIALHVEYNTSSDTVVEWRAYSESELFGGSPVTEADEVIIVGKVVVPGSGPISSSDVTLERRRSAWAAKSREIRDWHQVVVDSGFEFTNVGLITNAGGPLQQDMVHWDAQDLADNSVGGGWSVSDTSPRSGTREIRVGSAGVLFGVLFQRSLVRVVPDHFMKVSVWLRGDGWAASDGFQGVRIQFLDDSLSVISNVDVTDNSLDGTFAYTEVERVIEAPSGAKWVRVGVGVESTSSTVGDLFFDDFRVWIEGGDADDDPGIRRIAMDSVAGEGVSVSPRVDSDVTSVQELLERTLRLAYSEFTGGIVEYIGGLIGTAAAWRMNFTNGVVGLGNGLTGTAANALVPRIVFGARDNTLDRTLLFEVQISGQKNIRLYVGEDTTGSGDAIMPLEITFNARWTSSGSWTADDTAVYAVRIVLNGGPVGGEGGFSYQTRDITSSPWTVWGSAGAEIGVQGGSTGFGRIDLTDGRLEISTPGTNTNPAALTQVNGNDLVAKSMPKVWGYITTDGAGGVTLEDGYGIGAVSISGSRVQVSLFGTNGFANTDYAVVVTLHDQVAEYAFEEGSSTRAGGLFFVVATDGTSQVDLSANAREFSVLAFGEQ